MAQLCAGPHLPHLPDSVHLTIKLKVCTCHRRQCSSPHLSPMARTALRSTERAEVDGDRRRAGRVEPSTVEKAAAHSVSATDRQPLASGCAHRSAGYPRARKAAGERWCAKSRAQGKGSRLERPRGSRTSASLGQRCAEGPIDSMRFGRCGAGPHRPAASVRCVLQGSTTDSTLTHAASTIGYAAFHTA